MDENKADLKRRHFLVTLGAGGVGAAAAVATTTAKAAPTEALAQAAGEPARDQGLSEHARKYYRSARI